jgi:two-component system, OmpR family, response regulator
MPRMGRPKILLFKNESEPTEELRADFHHLGYAVHHLAFSREDLDGVRSGGPPALRGAQHAANDLHIADAFHKGDGETPVFVVIALSDAAEYGDVSDSAEARVAPGALDLSVVGMNLRRIGGLVGGLRVAKLRGGGLEMDLIDRTVRRGGSPIHLSPREFTILEYFMHRPGRLVTRAMLFRDVWRYRFAPETNTVDMHISRLRKKIDVVGETSLISNIRGAGFMWSVKE